MRLIHAAALLATVTLAACGNNPDEELTDEALSMDEVMAEIEDNGVMPQPGLYTANVELVSFEVPGIASSNIDMDTLLAEMEEGAASESTYCVTEEMDREGWISEMTDNRCTISRLVAEDGTIDMAMTCSAEDGPQGRIAMSGTAGETSSNMEMSFTQPIPGIGDANIVMRVISERTGECS